MKISQETCSVKDIVKKIGQKDMIVLTGNGKDKTISVDVFKNQYTQVK